ncbi:MAG: hypothetical protein V3V00_00420, partial [Saprospiraceae bacterium]
MEEQQNISAIQAGEEKSALIVEVDGSMIFTREESWKEVKLGRIFKHSLENKTDISADNQSVTGSSEYVSHLGGHLQFKEKMDKLLQPHKGRKSKLAFINDGAIWIENWVNTKYPQAVHNL